MNDVGDLGAAFSAAQPFDDLVAVCVHRERRHIDDLGAVKRGALGFEIILGALTTTGSLIAAGKLQGVIHGKPVQFRGQNIVNLGIFVAMIGCFVFFWNHPEAQAVSIHVYNSLTALVRDTHLRRQL